MAFLTGLQERDQFELNYDSETNVHIGNTGTPTEPPFWRIVAWNQHQQDEPEHYDVIVDQHNGFIIGGKS